MCYVTQGSFDALSGHFLKLTALYSASCACRAHRDSGLTLRWTGHAGPFGNIRGTLAHHLRADTASSVLPAHAIAPVWASGRAVTTLSEVSRFCTSTTWSVKQRISDPATWLSWPPTWLSVSSSITMSMVKQNKHRSRTCKPSTCACDTARPEAVSSRSSRPRRKRSDVPGEHPC
ncbi:hypothetical protein HDV57DRAFT_447526 [Trichoderma longibrachiatum]